MLLIFLLELFSISDHLLNFLLRQPSLIIRNGNLRALVGRLILSLNIEDTVSIKVKGNVDLWDSTRCRRNSSQFELSKEVVISGLCTLTLKDLNEYTRLVVSIG
mmetsp:Transcript_23785/g.33292  ORF Transcript_23785/g.33292 Transcript_23785/m.33292 type:complete len:104 (+) Transcript_23785:463-774(+)